MSDLTRLSAAELAGALASRELSSVEAVQAHLDRIAAVEPEIHAFLHVNAGALATAAEIDRRRAAGEELPSLAGVPSRSRTSWSRPTCRPRAAPASSRGTCRPLTRRSWRAPAPPASSRSARRTWTNSRWARRPSTPRTAPPTIRGTRIVSRADRAAVPRPRSRRSRRPSRSDPTRAGRSASPLTSRARSGSSRPTAP